MQQNGIRGPMLEWFKDYHKQRYNVVSIAGAHSDRVPTHHGTAQGSILGPTEYLLYVNDMCNLFQHASVYQFADDTCLITAHRDLSTAEKLMQTEFTLLCKWAHDVGLTINFQKTKLMHIHSPYLKTQGTPRVVAHEHQCMHRCLDVCDCKPIQNVKEHVYLGLKIDHKFNWGPHVDAVCDKLRAVMAKLRILKHKLPYRTLRLLYMALADSVINYGISSYGRTYKTYLQKIYNIQTRLLKIVVPYKIKLKYKPDYDKLFQYCKVINVFDKVKLAVASDYCENNMSKLQKVSRPNFARKLSYLSLYKLPKVNNEYGKRVWTYALPSILNNLPKEIVIKLENKKSRQMKNILKAYFTTKKFGMWEGPACGSSNGQIPVSE